MCGITGFLHFDKKRKADANKLKCMTDIIKYRGPDREGFYINENIGIGHRRLSIIDLDTGDQPMFSDDKDIVIVLNGEIYNYIELREELKKLGYNFKTTSDTEVVLKAYEEWGYNCQNKFNGMWAFAIWDNSKNELFISRDRIGEKPLHYTIFENSFIFGSEMKSLFSYGVPKNHDLSLLEIYLVLTNIPEPYSFYKNIFKLKAGHYLIVKNNKVNEFQYWDLPEIDESNMLKDKEYVYSKFPVNTFTIGFPEKDFDESKLALDVAVKFNTLHHIGTVTPENFDEIIAKTAFHYDEPFGDSSAIPTGYVSKFAKGKVKMVLTGDGGDEVLSGYNSFVGIKIALSYQLLPLIFQKGIPKFISLFKYLSKGRVRLKLNKIESISKTASLPFDKRIIQKMPYTDYNYIKKLVSNISGIYSIEDYFSEIMSKCPLKDEFYKLMYLNFKFNLPNDYLVKVDRMSMANSLEARMPFLDYRLIELMVKVDKNVKMQGWERKSVLRKTIGKTLPDSLLKAPKKGFGIPLREWFKKDSFGNKINTNLNEIKTILDKNTVDIIVNENNKGLKDHGNFIWSMPMLNRMI